MIKRFVVDRRATVRRPSPRVGADFYEVSLRLRGPVSEARFMALIEESAPEGRTSLRALIVKELSGVDGAKLPADPEPAAGVV